MPTLFLNDPSQLSGIILHRASTSAGCLQVERAFDALTEKAQAEIMEAAQAQAQQRVDKLLEAVDVGKFLHGEHAQPALSMLPPCDKPIIPLPLSSIRPG